MKKTIVRNIASVMSAIAVLSFFSSCEKDDSGKDKNSDSKTDSATIESIKADYALEFSEDVLKFYDITVTYGTDGKTEKTENISNTKWPASCTYNEDKLPASVFCKAVMTPKTERPSIEPETVYTVTKNKNCSVSAIYKDGKNSVLNVYENSSSNPVKGKKFEEYLNKGEQVACDSSYSIKY